MTFQLQKSKAIFEFGRELFDFWGLIFHWPYFRFDTHFNSCFVEDWLSLKISAGTKVELILEKNIFWRFTAKVLGFGLTISKQKGY